MGNDLIINGVPYNVWKQLAAFLQVPIDEIVHMDALTIFRMTISAIEELPQPVSLGRVLRRKSVPASCEPSESPNRLAVCTVRPLPATRNGNTSLS